GRAARRGSRTSSPRARAACRESSTAHCGAPRGEKRLAMGRRYSCEDPGTGYDPPMRRPHEEIREVRVPSEVLARWALETSVGAQEATAAALAFLVHVEHASINILPVPTILRSEQAVQDPDGFLRQPRGAVEHFRLRSQR